MNKTIVVIPSFNELKTLKMLLPKLQEKNINFVVIDDGSSDGTFNYLSKNYEKKSFIHHIDNKGYENAIYSGYEYAKKNRYGYLATFDGDFQHDISDLIKMIKVSENFDLIIGVRDKKNFLIEFLINYYYFKKLFIKDVLSGLKIYNLNKITFFKPFKNFNTAGISFTIMAHKYSPLIYNFPIKIKKRRYGISKFGDFFYGNFYLLIYFINSLKKY